MRIDHLPQYHRNAWRFGRILAVFGKYGLGGLLAEGNPRFIRYWFTDGDGRDLAGQPLGERLRGACVELGPSFIKLGQICSGRPDLVGTETARSLELLQDQVPADDEATVRTIITEALGRPPEELFASFEPVPLASASIGQVHAATLADGRAVVVKVRHAGIERDVRTDFDILEGLARFAEDHSETLRQHRPTRLVIEFRRQLLGELDFRRERRNLQLMAERFADYEDLVFPAVYEEFCATTVLTMDRLEGTSLHAWEVAGKTPGDAAEGEVLARLGARVYADMIFREGVFHADPHPGNIFILPGRRIGLVDLGTVGHIDEELREQLVQAMLAIKTGDSRTLARLAARIGSAPPELDRATFGADVSRFLSDYTSLEIGGIDISTVLEDFLELIHRHRIVLPPSLALLIKVLLSLEGSARRLDPRFSLAEVLEPYQRELFLRRFSPREMARRLRRMTVAWQSLLGSLPGDIDDLIWRASRGELELQVQHHRLEEAANRLVAGIIAAAGLLGGSYLMGARLPPCLWSISLPGFCLAGVGAGLSFILLRAIHRAGGFSSQSWQRRR